MSDPTRDEMLTFLCGFWPYEVERFDREEAIYWFAYNWHSGQWSNLYSVLSTSKFRPSPLANGPEETAVLLIEEIEKRFS